MDDVSKDNSQGQQPFYEAPFRTLTKEDFGEIPEWACALFAARCALRVWPFYGYEVLDEARESQQAGKLFASLPMAVETICVLPLGIADDDALAEAYGVAFSVADAAAEAAYARVNASRVDAADVVAAATIAADASVASEGAARAYAATAAAYARIGDENTDAAIEHAYEDYTFLLSHARTEEKLAVFDELHGRPLWYEDTPRAVLRLLNQLYKWIDSVSDLSERERGDLRAQLEQYEAMLYGNGFDYARTTERVERWLSSQGTRIEFPALPEELNYPEKQRAQTREAARLTALDKAAPSGVGASERDAPTLKDALGRRGLARDLAALFASPVHATPCTLALWGDWGSGKSSVMDMIDDELSKIEDSPDAPFRFHRAKFNAWEYEQTDNIRAALAQEVVIGLTDRMGWWRKLILKLDFALRVHFVPVLKIIVMAFIVLFISYNLWPGLLKELDANSYPLRYGGFGAAVVMVVILAWKQLRPLWEHPLATDLSTYMNLPDYGEHLGIIPEIKRNIRVLCRLRGVHKNQSEDDETKQNRTVPKRLKCIRKARACLKTSANTTLRNDILDFAAWCARVQLARASSHRLVVYVDDLDRCRPDCINETLDALRLIMDIPNVIVVLAIDNRIAMSSVASRYGKGANEERTAEAIARDYLGKLIQLSVTLTPPKDMNKFIDERLFQHMEKASPAGDQSGESDSGSVSSDSATVDDEDPKQPEAPDAPADRALAETQGVVKEDPKSTEESEPDEPSAHTEGAQPVAARLREVAPNTVKEREMFRRLTETMDFMNPRQLIRLQNTYRLLKMRPPVKLKAGQYAIYERMMKVLFWLEYVNEFSKGKRDRCAESVMRSGDPIDNGTAEGIVKELIAQGGKHGVEDYDKLKAHVERFVLPAGTSVAEAAVGEEGVEEQAVEEEDK